MNLNPRHFTRVHDYVACELARMNTIHRRIHPWWKLNKNMTASRPVAEMCTEWVLKWQQAHNDVPTL